MACPYFMPVERLENGSWPHPSRLPLGGGWRGHCTASGHEGEIPSQDILEAFCNLGYASGCAWTPPDRIWDAVRFAVAPPADSGKRGEETIPRSDASAGILHLHLRFACERNHLPVAHGELHFDVPRATWLRRHDDARIQRMAECFLESYRQKKA